MVARCTFFSRFFFALFLGLFATLSACQMVDSNRPQDKKVAQQEQRLNMAIQQLEAEADRVVLEGKKLYGDTSQKVQDFTGQTKQSLEEISRLTQDMVEQTKRLQQLPQAIQAGSEQALAAAKSVVGYSPSPTQVPAQKAQEPRLFP